MPRLRNAAAVALATAALAACDATSPSDIRVIATLEKSSLSLSDSTAVTLQAVNVGLRTARGVHPDNYGMCNHAYRVFRDDREVSVPSGLCVLASLANTAWFSPVRLTPGAMVTIRDRWVPASSTLDGAPIGPGTYTIVGIYHADQTERRSAPVSVTITP